MKKIFGILALVLGCSVCHAQNYQCLQSGVTRYFINGNNYLRGMRIDSVKTYPDSVIWYPFHTNRGPWDGFMAHSLDKDGGCWLGKKVKQLPDGTFLFDSYWNDSVVTIKTQANTGESWVMYKDTGSLYYNASVTGTDTMTIAGSVDSIKNILVTAVNSSGVVAADPLNNFRMALSKNNGFAQVFDLYTFPYHKPDSAYRPGLDFFLDQTNMTSGGYHPWSKPDTVAAIFRVADFVSPNEQELYPWSIGDVISSSMITGLSIGGSYNRQLLQDTVTGKTVSGHITTFTVSGSTPECPYSFYRCKSLCPAGTYAFSDLVSPVIGNGQIPEDSYNGSSYVFYYPDDTTYCLHSPAYTSVAPSVVGLGAVTENVTYKMGIGKVYYHYQDGEPTNESDDLLYYHIGAATCGTPLAVKEPAASKERVTIAPNPAQTDITLTSSTVINSVIISDITGRMVYDHQYSSRQVQINVSGFSSGVYLFRINGTEVHRLIKE